MEAEVLSEEAQQADFQEALLEVSVVRADSLAVEVLWEATAEITTAVIMETYEHLLRILVQVPVKHLKAGWAVSLKLKK